MAKWQGGMERLNEKSRKNTTTTTQHGAFIFHHTIKQHTRQRYNATNVIELDFVRSML